MNRVREGMKHDGEHKVSPVRNLRALIHRRPSSIIRILCALILLIPAVPEAAAGVTVIIGNASGNPGTQVLVPVQVNGFTDIGEFQFIFNWNTNHAKFLDVEQTGLPGLAPGIGNFGLTTETNVGRLRVSWDDPAGGGQTVQDGTTIFAVRLLLVGTIGSTSDMFINGTPTFPLEANNSILEPVSLAMLTGHLTIGQPNTAPVLAAIGNKTINEGS